jgi:hypothetical protein
VFQLKTPKIVYQPSSLSSISLPPENPTNLTHPQTYPTDTHRQSEYNHRNTPSPTNSTKYPHFSDHYQNNPNSFQHPLYPSLHFPEQSPSPSYPLRYSSSPSFCLPPPQTISERPSSNPNYIYTPLHLNKVASF